jgi:hypothetical protein
MTASDLVHDLEQRLAAAKTNLQELKRDTRKRHRGQAEARRQVAEHLEVAATIMTLQDGHLDAALSYCAQAGLDGVESKTLLEERLLRGSLEDMVTRLHGVSRTNTRRVSRAKAFLVQWNVAGWVHARNDTEGIAPAYERVFSEMLDRHAEAHGGHRRAAPDNHRSRVQWVRRFSRRWNGTHGSVKTQRGHTEEELRRQAAASKRSMLFFRFLQPLFGPVFGPEKRARFRCLCICWY